MISSRMFWGLHEKLLLLLREQTAAVLNYDDELYEQARLEILETIRLIRSKALGIEECQDINDFAERLFTS